MKPGSHRRAVGFGFPVLAALTVGLWWGGVAPAHAQGAAFDGSCCRQHGALAGVLNDTFRAANSARQRADWRAEIASLRRGADAVDEGKSGAAPLDPRMPPQQALYEALQQVHAAFEERDRPTISRQLRRAAAAVEAEVRGGTPGPAAPPSAAPWSMPPSGFGGGRNEFENALDGMIGRGMEAGRRAAASQPAPSRVPIKPRGRPGCPQCKGSGYSSRMCILCDGSGTNPLMAASTFHVQQPCGHCEGTGYRPCEACRGEELQGRVRVMDQQNQMWGGIIGQHNRDRQSEQRLKDIDARNKTQQNLAGAINALDNQIAHTSDYQTRQSLKQQREALHQQYLNSLGPQR